MRELNKYVKDEIWCVMHDIYRDIYNNSKPKGDWDTLIKNYSESKGEFWRKYRISNQEKCRIIRKHLDQLTDISTVNKFFIYKFITSNY